LSTEISSETLEHFLRRKNLSRQLHWRSN